MRVAKHEVAEHCCSTTPVDDTVVGNAPGMIAEPSTKCWIRSPCAAGTDWAETEVQKHSCCSRLIAYVTTTPLPSRSPPRAQTSSQAICRACPACPRSACPLPVGTTQPHASPESSTPVLRDKEAGTQTPGRSARSLRTAPEDEIDCVPKQAATLSIYLRHTDLLEKSHGSAGASDDVKSASFSKYRHFQLWDFGLSYLSESMVGSLSVGWQFLWNHVQYGDVVCDEDGILRVVDLTGCEWSKMEDVHQEPKDEEAVSALRS
jgi:hypothetical protein